MESVRHSFLDRTFPRDKDYVDAMDEVEMDDDDREKMREESNRPEDEGFSEPRVDDASEEHALVETRQDGEAEEVPEDEVVVMAPQDIAEQ